MSMQPWERSIVEYRPNIGMDRDILTKIIKRTNREVGRTFTPTKSLMTRQSYFATDIIDSLMATLSALTELKNHIESTLAYNPVFEEYKRLVNEDDKIGAADLHEENMISLDGTPQLDVYPDVINFLDEVTQYLDYINDELFDGDIDYSDTSGLRDKEKAKIEALFELEAAELTQDINPSFTEAQLVLIERLTQDPSSNINTIQKYIDYLQEEKRKEGASTINYKQMNDESRIIVSHLKKADMFKDSTSHISEYLYSSLSAFVHEDVQGSLEYLVDMAGLLSDMKSAYEISHQQYAISALNTHYNKIRVADREVREMMDKKLSALRQKKSQIVNSLSYRLKTPHEAVGAHALKETMQEGIHSVNNLWTFMLTEHMGTSEMNIDQNKKYTDDLTRKRQHQMMYKYADLVQREFDFENKDRELKTFASTQNLYTRW